MALEKKLLKLMTRTHVWLYRITHGRIGSMGGTVLLITTTGAKSGERRTIPLGGVPHEGGWLLSAAAAGSPRHPAWYHNVVAHSEVTVTNGSEDFIMTARTAGPEERPALAQRITEFDNRFADMEAKVEREIPVVILERKSQPGIA